MKILYTSSSKKLFFCGLFSSLVLSCIQPKKTRTNTSLSSTKEESTIKLSITKKLGELDNQPIAKRIAFYHQLKKENFETYNFENEDELTMYGYRHLWSNQLTDALEIFKLIVSQFPNSSNPYDSLGEAYLALGDSISSLKNYQKSLALNPNNFNAEDQIENIKNPYKKRLTPKEKLSKVFSKKDYTEDLDQLGKKLIEVNPSALKFISRKDFHKTIENKKALLTERTTFGEFIWHCSEIIANVNCSHTSMGEFYTESEMLQHSQKFPLKTRWVDGKLLVIDVFANANKVAIQDEIISINGILIAQIVKEIFNHISTQGNIETPKAHYFYQWSSDLITYALNFPNTYTIQVKGKELPIALNSSKNIPTPFADNHIDTCDDGLCFEQIDENTALLTVATFNYYPWNNLEVFQNFIDKSFKTLAEKKIKNLIIDVRSNGGGSPESSIYLLKYLVSMPFEYFISNPNSSGYGSQKPFPNNYKGNVYFLMDGRGESTTGHFMAIAKDLKLGTIIGEELGSNQFCTAGQTVLRLSNTKLIYNVANVVSKLATTSFSDEIGILPDHTISPSIEDFTNRIDTVKKYAIQLIND